MADPDLQIRWEGGGVGHPDPEIRRGAQSAKKFYSALRASVWSKNKGWGGGGGFGGQQAPPLDLPLILTQLPPTRPNILLLLHLIFSCFNSYN